MRHGLLNSAILALLLAAPALAQAPKPDTPKADALAPKVEAKAPESGPKSPAADAKTKQATKLPKATAKPVPDVIAPVKPEVAAGSKLRSQALKQDKKSREIFKGPRVDINGASKEELKKLPGVTEALAGKIIMGRPYRTKAHLVTHDVLPYAVYEGIKRRIVAMQKSAK